MRKIFYVVAAMFLAAGCCNESKCCDKECEKKCENPVIETIMARRSIRKYTDQAVPRELLDKIAECGINAPNGMNAQQWEVRIVDNPEWLKSITEAQRKAALMADAAGMKLGGIEEIIENNGGYAVYKNAMFDMAAASAGSTTILADGVDVTASVTVTFEMK
jgi:uncharacterized protein YggE